MKKPSKLPVLDFPSPLIKPGDTHVPQRGKTVPPCGKLDKLEAKILTQPKFRDLLSQENTRSRGVKTTFSQRFFDDKFKR